MTYQVSQRSDVSMLNALQIHSAEENVYFSSMDDREYVEELLSSHRPFLRPCAGGFQVHKASSICGNDDELVHIFEPQLPITLDLSFLQVKRLPAEINIMEPRSARIAKVVDAQLTNHSIRGSSLDVDDLVKSIEANVILRSNVS
jgi:hypothetical protein